MSPNNSPPARGGEREHTLTPLLPVSVPSTFNSAPSSLSEICGLRLWRGFLATPAPVRWLGVFFVVGADLGVFVRLVFRVVAVVVALWGVLVLERVV